MSEVLVTEIKRLPRKGKKGVVYVEFPNRDITCLRSTRGINHRVRGVTVRGLKQVVNGCTPGPKERGRVQGIVGENDWNVDDRNT